MKSTFKPLGIAAAVAAATAAFAGSAVAQGIDGGDLGDLAIVPYYTTQAGYVTGVHITNTSPMYTQVVKLRLRRGSDSMDALDFNLVLSPNDMWTGTVKMNEDGKIIFRTGDDSCTAPARNVDGGFEMPDPDFDTLIDFRDGAEEGYIEVIGMGQADPTQPIAQAALHAVTGAPGAMPADCGAVRQNFFRNATTAPVVGSPLKGITSSMTSNQTWECDAANDGLEMCESMLESTDNVLTVSYFVRDGESGLEMGSKAVHIADFSTEAMMSNQVGYDLAITDLYAYFYPDLDGGSPADTTRGLYDTVIRPALGVADVMNDWSVNADLNVQTDWVVTLPGQYLMVHRNKYFAHDQSLRDDDDSNDIPCLKTAVAPGAPGEIAACDFRDIPVTAAIMIWDREEQETIIIDPEDELVVSPSVGVDPLQPAILLPYEVNVIKWFGPDTDGEDGVLSSQYAGSIDVGDLGVSGWARLSITADATKRQAVCDQEMPLASTDAVVQAGCLDVAEEDVPMVGFVAWKRSFPDQPDGNYGRIIDHSWTAGS